MSIQVRYTEILKQVLGMIIIPTVLIFSFILLLLSLKKFQFSEMLMNILTYGGTFIVIGISVLIILNVIITKADLEYDNAGLTITMHEGNWLFPHRQEIPFSNLRQFSVDTDDNDRVFISIKTHTPKKSILLFPEVQDEPDAFVEFGTRLNEHIARVSAGSPDFVVQQSGFYQGPWMKGLAVITLIFVILITVLKIYHPESVTNLRLLFMYVVAVPFLIKVFSTSSK
ncbi:MAG: hypothetical protein U0T77_09395 [Chitinophagales bacterium]